MSAALNQLPSEALAWRHIPSAESPVVPSPGFQSLETPEQVFPRVGSFWRGRDGLAMVQHVCAGGVVDFYFQGVMDSLPASDFSRRFPAESRI